MKTTLASTILITTVPTYVARVNMRDVYRIDLGSQKSSPSEAIFNTWRRKLEIETEMSMPVDTMSMLIDETMSFENTMCMSMCMSMSTPFFVDPRTITPVPSTCDTTYTCPDTGTCECSEQVQDGGEICGCYTISSVSPPFDTFAVPASGTWYCYQVDLDKSVQGCSGAKPVTHAVLPTGLSESCHFHQGGRDSAGSDNWFTQTCDSTATTGLKFDFGHTGSSNQLSVTYCIDVACEAAPAGDGSIIWVLKSGSDRCEIKVTEGAIPSCGVSSDFCHPSCSDDNSNNGGGGSGGSNGGSVGNSKNVIPTESDGATADNGNRRKNWIPVVASILAVAGVVALAGVTYNVVAWKTAATAAAAGGDVASLASVDTPMA